MGLPLSAEVVANDAHKISIREVPRRPNQFRQRLVAGSAAEQTCIDGGDGLEPGFSRPGFLEQTRIVDGDARSICQNLEYSLVAVVECSPFRAVREVDAAEHLAPDEDRNTEKRVHRRVIGRKPCRGRMRGDSVGSNRARFSNDQAQQAVSFGKMPDLGNLPPESNRSG